jgi:hypothetical protein
VSSELQAQLKRDHAGRAITVHIHCYLNRSRIQRFHFIGLAFEQKQIPRCDCEWRHLRADEAFASSVRLSFDPLASRHELRASPWQRRENSQTYHSFPPNERHMHPLARETGSEKEQSSFQALSAHHYDSRAQRRQDGLSGCILRMSNSESPASLADEYFLREASRILPRSI